MSDDLRDRIAAVLYEAVRDKCDGYVADVIAAGQPIDPLADEVLVDGLLEFPALADAVIEALGLTRVTRSQNPPIHRYVTEWTADD